MAYAPPTASDLKARFPAFASVADDVVTAALGEAARLVDESWTEGDFANARMLYACHILLMDGHGTGGEADMLVDMPAGYKRTKAGGSEIERFGSATAGGTTDPLDLQSTSYGRRFASLMRRNISTVFVV
jgi:hypothetical protein